MFGRRRKQNDLDVSAVYAQAKALRAFADRPEKMRLLGVAADAGHAVAAFDLGVLHERDHDLGGARLRYEQAQALGHQVAGKFLSALAETEARLASTREHLEGMRRVAETGDPAAMRDYAWKLRTDSRSNEADEWFRRAAVAGDSIAIREVAAALPWQDEEHGVERAERMLRDDAGREDPVALAALARFLREHRPEAAFEVLERLHALGDQGAAADLARMHWGAGRLEAAEQWFRRAVPTDPEQLDEVSAALGGVLLELGRIDEAEPLLRRHMDGDLHLAWLLEGRGDDDEALKLYGTLVEQDDDQFEAKAGLARIHRRRGEVDEAESWTEQALQAGADMALPRFARP